MAAMKHYLLILCFMSSSGCSSAQSAQPKIEHIVIDSKDAEYGYYFSVKPRGEVHSVLVLFPGFSQNSESVFLDTEFHTLAYEQNIWVVGFAGRMKMTADSALISKINPMLAHVLDQTGVAKDQVVLGGFSAGGVIALRYTELCHQYPDQYPIAPKAVFVADAPVDLYHSWKLQEYNRKHRHSEISANEADWIAQYYRASYGATPSEDPKRFMDLSPFSIDPKYGTHERHLKDVAVRAYHDIDVAWRLVHRNQTATFDNYIATAELINRLMLMGNERAEFVQTFQTGYCRNGQRHPHSWSIVDVEECLEWIRGIDGRD